LTAVAAGSGVNVDVDFRKPDFIEAEVAECGDEVHAKDLSLQDDSGGDRHRPWSDPIAGEVGVRRIATLMEPSGGSDELSGVDDDRRKRSAPPAAGLPFEQLLV
jgi:hypothetical protein